MYTQGVTCFRNLCPKTGTVWHTGVPTREALPFASQTEAGGQKGIEALGSKEIRKVKFRPSWVFLEAKGFELPARTQREKVSRSF